MKTMDIDTDESVAKTLREKRKASEPDRKTAKDYYNEDEEEDDEEDNEEDNEERAKAKYRTARMRNYHRKEMTHLEANRTTDQTKQIRKRTF